MKKMWPCRIDILEGEWFPKGRLVVWGKIIPLTKAAPIRKYFILKLPLWKFATWDDFNSDRRITEWRQLVLVYTASIGKWPKWSFDGWRFYYANER